MSHFAEINDDNIVTRVLVGNSNLPEEGKQWFENNLGGRWVQTSYNGTIRKNFAGAGYTYNEGLDAFVPPKPYASWQLNEESCLWEAPTQRPDDEFYYKWNETELSWELEETQGPEA